MWTIHAGGKHACPLINFTAFDSFYAAVYGLDPTPSANSVAKTFGAAFNPWLDDETFVTSVLALEELGAKGNKVCRVIRFCIIVSGCCHTLGT